MSSPIVVFGGSGSGGGTRRRSHAHAHHAKGIDSETAGWLIFGALAIAAIYWLTRPKGAAAASPQASGLNWGGALGSTTAGGPVGTVTIGPQIVLRGPGSTAGTVVPGTGGGTVCEMQDDGSLACDYPPGVTPGPGGDCVSAPDGSTFCTWAPGTWGR